MIVGERRSHVRRAEDVILDDRMWRVVSDGSKRRRSHGRHVQRRHGRDATDGGSEVVRRQSRVVGCRILKVSREWSAADCHTELWSRFDITVERWRGGATVEHHTTSRGSRGCRPVSRERPAVSRRGLSAMPRDRRPGSRLNAGAAT